jgi:hypothetical protein
MIELAGFSGDEDTTKILISRNGYEDLSDATILASGLLGRYYVFSERLLDDKGAWNQIKEIKSRNFIEHALKIMGQDAQFNLVIDNIVEEVSKIAGRSAEWDLAIAGGERRDWLFSGPVAKKLEVPHVSVYKDGRIEVLNPNLEPVETNRSLYVVPVADLITTASSFYRLDEGGKAIGWLPWLRGAGHTVEKGIVTVSRCQGAEKKLAPQRLELKAQVYIDEAFLRKVSRYPDEAVQYLQMEQQKEGSWGEWYLREKGALPLLPSFDPTKKPDKVVAFMKKYGEFVKAIGRYDELESAVKEKYGMTIQQVADLAPKVKK